MAFSLKAAAASRRRIVAAFAGVAMALAVGLNAKAQDVTDFEPENTIVITIGLGYADYAAETAPESTGVVAIRLRPDLAPGHVERIKLLAREGFYDNVPFHRVIPGFMAQTGDPTGRGTGGSSYPDLAAEFTKEPFVRGTAGMARSSLPDSANSQFFIMYDRNDYLDEKYTVFGEVIEGMDIVEQIRNSPADRNGVLQAPPDRMVSVRVAADIDWTPSASE